MGEICIRKIERPDNEQIAVIIRKVLLDFNVPKEGSAYSDVALDDMTAAYSGDKTVYFVVLDDETIMGGGGIAPLDNYEGNVCELQKMYMLESLRGRGIGKKLIQMCIDRAIDFGYEGCYLETMPNMKVAQKIYRHFGFQYLEGPMGNTGHCACPVWMYLKF